MGVIFQAIREVSTIPPCMLTLCGMTASVTVLISPSFKVLNTCPREGFRLTSTHGRWKGNAAHVLPWNYWRAGPSGLVGKQNGMLLFVATIHAGYLGARISSLDGVPRCYVVSKYDLVREPSETNYCLRVDFYWRKSRYDIGSGSTSGRTKHARRRRSYCFYLFPFGGQV